MHGQAPAYPSELLRPYPFCPVRSDPLNLLSVPHTHFKTRAEQAFEAAAAKLWSACNITLCWSCGFFCWQQTQTYLARHLYFTNSLFTFLSAVYDFDLCGFGGHLMFYVVGFGFISRAFCQFKFSFKSEIVNEAKRRLRNKFGKCDAHLCVIWVEVIRGKVAFPSSRGVEVMWAQTSQGQTNRRHFEVHGRKYGTQRFYNFILTRS